MIKQNNSQYLISKAKTFSSQNTEIFCISIGLGFSLNNFLNGHQLISGYQVGTIIENSMGFDTFWDAGIPKGKAEFLVYGAAYSPKAVQGMSVNVSVADKSKVLMIFGNRQWTEYGPSIPTSFNIMPISYNYAFGGNNFELNPVGVGFGNDTARLLPNIETPDQLILSKDDVVTPAGYEPYPLTWPQRYKATLAYQNQDFTNSYITIPPEVLPEDFNSAPHDQRLDGFFYGNETIEITNMHPLYPNISSSLPNVRLRVFVIQEMTDGTEILHEMGIQADTLWLLPNVECGILQYHATCQTTDKDHSDIKFVYFTLEQLDQPAYSTEYYFNEIIKLYKPEQIIDYQETHPTAIVEQEKNKDIDTPEIEYTIPQNTTKSKYATDNTNETSTEDDLTNMLKTQVNELMRQFKIDQQKINAFTEARESSGLPTMPQLDEILKAMHDVGIYDNQIESNLIKAFNLIAELQENEKENSDVTAKESDENN